MWTGSGLDWFELVKYAGGAVLLVASSAIGGYWGAYAKKKGEDDAASDRFGEVLKELRETTTLAKSIEAKISGDMWDRQKQWEMKREVLFDAARRLSEVDDALLTFTTTMREDQKCEKIWANDPPSDAERLSWHNVRHDRVARWAKASTEFDESRLFINVVCTKSSMEAFQNLAVLVHNLAAAITKDAESYERSKALLHRSILEAQFAIRKELGVDLTSQSNKP